jgi:hypothetical protein
VLAGQINAASVVEAMTFFQRGYLTKEIPPKMAFAVPISFFKSISIIFREAGLIFEGLTNRGGCGNEKFY